MTIQRIVADLCPQSASMIELWLMMYTVQRLDLLFRRYCHFQFQDPIIFIHGLGQMNSQLYGNDSGSIILKRRL